MDECRSDLGSDNENDAVQDDQLIIYEGAIVAFEITRSRNSSTHDFFYSYEKLRHQQNFINLQKKVRRFLSLLVGLRLGQVFS